MKICEADNMDDRICLLQTSVDLEPGTILKADHHGIDVRTGSGVLRIKKVHFPNCNSMTVGQYICGHEIKVGTMLK